MLVPEYTAAQKQFELDVAGFLGLDPEHVSQGSVQVEFEPAARDRWGAPTGEDIQRIQYRGSHDAKPTRPEPLSLATTVNDQVFRFSIGVLARDLAAYLDGVRANR